MLVYILKSVACLAILIAFYKLFLERENMHKFKRFYLLGALVFSLLVPLVVFTEYIEVAPLSEVQVATVQPQLTQEVITIQPKENTALDFAPILWGIYFVGLFFFGLKFIINLFQVLGRIRKNPKNKLARFTQVLLREKLPPHTFFKYIFLNKTKFESNQIPKEVLLHEETHAAQKHSIDVVFVELLQVIFWVNPFIYLAKKAMKLNHEFLADQAVLQNNIDATSYKNTLLSYLSPDSKYMQEPQMTNSINYSSIKKRFTVMKTQTSKKAVLLRSLLVLPLLASMVYGFSTKNVETKVIEFDQNHQDHIIELEVYQDSILLNAIKFELHQISKAIEKEIDPEIALENHYVDGLIHIDFEDDFMGKVLSEIKKTGITNIKFCTPTLETTNSISIVINKNGQLLVQDELVPLVDLPDFLSNINKHLSKEELKNSVTATIQTNYGAPQNIITKVEKIIANYGAGMITIQGNETGASFQEGSTRNQLTKDRKLVFKFDKKGQLYLNKNFILIEDVLKKLSNANFIQINQFTKAQIHAKNSSDTKINELIRVLWDAGIAVENVGVISINNKEKQKLATKKQVAEYNALAKKYNTMLSKSKSIQIRMKDVERLQYIYGLMSDKQKKKAEAFPDFPEPPPMPNAPEAPEPPQPPNYPEMKQIQQQLELTRQENERLRKKLEAKMEKQKNMLEQEEALLQQHELSMQEQEEALLQQHELSMQEQELSMREQEMLMKDHEARLQEIIENQEINAYQHSSLNYSKPKAPEDPEIPNTRHFYMGGDGFLVAFDNPRITNKKSGIPQPPQAPREPISHLDYIIKMAKEGAIFKYKRKIISSDEAIEIIKRNKNLSINTKRTNNETPIVRISKYL